MSRASLHRPKLQQLRHTIGGGGGGDARTRYLLGNKLSTYRSYALQDVQVLYPEQSYQQGQFRLSKFGEDLLKLPAGDAVFRFTCGDRFTVGIRRGGQFSAVISVDTHTTKDQQEIESEISASAAQGKMSASLKQRFESYQSKGNLQIDVLRDGLEDVLPNLDLANLLNYSLEFPKKIADAKQMPIRELITADYTPLLLQAANKDLGATPHWATLLSDQFAYLRKLAKYRGDLVYIRDHKDQFVAFDERQLLSKLNHVNNAMDGLIVWARECVRSRGGTCPDTKSTNISIPMLAPIRALDWVTLDPRLPSEQPIGETLPSFPMILELRGKWHYGRGISDINPVTIGTELRLQNKANPDDRRIIAPLQYSHQIPANFLVSFWFAEKPYNYSDNNIYQSDPSRGRLGGPVDNFVSGE